MIISDSKKFIFVHIPKVCGTSVRTRLERYASVSVYQGKRVSNIKQVNPALWKHAPAYAIRQNYDKNKWDQYFTFGFVRNPWSWAVSLYCYIKKDKKDPRYVLANRLGFRKFIAWFSTQSPKEYPARAGQKQYLESRRGKVMVKFVGRFESINVDFSKICKKLKLSCKLPKTNSTKHRHYSLYYDDKSRDLVYAMFKKDVDYFNYAF